MRVWIFVSIGALVAGSAAACNVEVTSNEDGSTSGTAGTTNNTGGSTSTATANGGSTSTSTSNGGAGGSGASGSGGTGAIGNTVRLIAIGDTGEGNADQHCVADAMSVKCMNDGCDAILLAGDNFYDEGVTDVNDVQWMDKFELPYDRAGLNGLPFYAVLGNHDYSPAALQVILDHDGNKDAQIEYSTLPIGNGPGQRYSDKWRMPSPYYDVVLGDGRVHLFGMDGQDATDTQLNDMSQRVSSSTAHWKLVFNHFPRFTSGDHQDDMPFLNLVLGFSGPDLYELQQAIYCNADLFLSGHDHDREFIRAGQDGSCPNTDFIVTGAGAKVDTVSHTVLDNSEYLDNTIEGFFYLVFEANQIVVESYDMTPNDCGAAGTATPAFATTIPK